MLSFLSNVYPHSGTNSPAAETLHRLHPTHIGPTFDEVDRIKSYFYGSTVVMFMLDYGAMLTSNCFIFILFLYVSIHCGLRNFGYVSGS